MSKNHLRIDWATHEAAKYACQNWHYSACLPPGKLVKVGAWEDAKFIGVVVFGRGATPNLGKPYGLQQTECVELVRIALTKHRAPVSRIASLAIRFLKKHNPGVRLIVSFADPYQGHVGGIYQAGNWLYAGQRAPAKFYMINAKLTHPRSIGSRGMVQNIVGARRLDPLAKVVEMPGKHRYLMPLDSEMRRQLLPLSQPYPKRANASEGKESSRPATSREEGGASPTLTLHPAGDFHAPSPEA